jgi:hypothetical protein
MARSLNIAVFLLLVEFLLFGCGRSVNPVPTPTPNPAPTATSTPAPTPTLTSTAPSESKELGVPAFNGRDPRVKQEFYGCRQEGPFPMDGALRPPPHDQGQSPIRPRLTRMLQPLRTPTGEPNEFVRRFIPECRSFCTKSNTTPGYWAKPVKRS